MSVVSQRMAFEPLGLAVRLFDACHDLRQANPERHLRTARIETFAIVLL
jgi:hypothetical protein